MASYKSIASKHLKGTYKLCESTGMKQEVDCYSKTWWQLTGYKLDDAMQVANPYNGHGTPTQTDWMFCEGNGYGIVFKQTANSGEAFIFANTEEELRAAFLKMVENDLFTIRKKMRKRDTLKKWK